MRTKYNVYVELLDEEECLYTATVDVSRTWGWLWWRQTEVQVLTGTGFESTWEWGDDVLANPFMYLDSWDCRSLHADLVYKSRALRNRWLLKQRIAAYRERTTEQEQTNGE